MLEVQAEELQDGVAVVEGDADDGGQDDGEEEGLPLPSGHGVLHGGGVVHPRERDLGHGQVQELAQRLPTLLDAEHQ